MDYLIGALVGVALCGALAVWIHRRKIRETIKTERLWAEKEIAKAKEEIKARLKV
jgi:hypothetical protein